MLDNELILLFRPLLINGLSSAGFNNVVVQQGYQPTAQGVPVDAVVSFFKIGDHRFGTRSNNTVYDLDEEEMITTEIQIYETTFQISALLRQIPTDISFTASDLVNECARIMNTQNTVDALNENSVGVLRVSEVRNIYFKDDRDQNEASPSFDFVLTHKNIYKTTARISTGVKFNIYRV